MQKRCVRLSLGHAVKIDPNIDRRLAAGHALPQASIKLCQSRRLFRLHAFLARVVRRRLTGGLFGRDAKRGLGAAAQWRRPARESAPQRLLVLAQTAPAHRRRRTLDLLFVEGAALGPAALTGVATGLASGNGTSSAALSGTVGSGIESRLKLNKPGRVGGNGTSLAAATGSSSRGTSITNLPGFLMRPAMRAASSPAPK